MLTWVSCTSIGSAGVDFRVKYLNIDGQRVKLTVWDTAGQERFRTLTSSYYRGAHGIIFGEEPQKCKPKATRDGTYALIAAVYDVTRRDTFDNLDRIWMKEVDIYSNIEDAVKMVVANKVDLVSFRA